MRQVVTNIGTQALDAHNNNFEPPGALTSITNTQRSSLRRLIYNSFAEVSSHTRTAPPIDKRREP